MSYIAVVPEDRATGAAEALYAEEREADGFVPNSTKAFSLRPEYLVAWEGLLAAIKARMELRRYELVTLAAAKALRSSYCMLAHGSVVLREFFSEDELRAIAEDHRRAGLVPAEVAVMDFATAVVRDAAAITKADVAALRAHGLSDGEICDVVAAAAVRCFLSKFVDAVGTQPDGKYVAMRADLRQALVVGRAIEEPQPAK
jgi:uncharacterized peroxidase-related enzyme